MNIIGHRKIYYLLSGAVLLASVISITLWGFRSGIDFAGGSLWKIRSKALSASQIRELFKEQGLGEIQIQAGADNVFTLRSREIDEEAHQALAAELALKDSALEELRFETVGPTIGKTLRRKAVRALIVAIGGISIYIAWAFRKVSRPIASWKYGVVTVITLFHDVVVPLGLFSYLGKLAQIEIDSNLIVALLVVMGFSVHDTIVVFDRIRENLKRSPGEFGQVVNRSVNETLARSINTSLTTLLALWAVMVLGAASLKYFVLAMIVGILTGTYSSIFIASPLLVDWEKFESRKK